MFGVIASLAKSRELTLAAARRFLADHLASIELVPYHSAKSSLSESTIKQLESATIARDFVQTEIRVRAESNKALVIVVRKSAMWALPPDIPSIVTYDGAEARAAHMTPDSPGGRAILEWLSER